MKRFYPPYRLGLKQNRAVLDSMGHEVVLFPKGCEYLASRYVEHLNEDFKGYDKVLTAGDIAQCYKVPIGTLGCPHCGQVVHGAITSTICCMCDKDMFIKPCAK